MRRKLRPDPAKDQLARHGSYIAYGELLLTDHEWNGGITPDEATLAKRRQEVAGVIMRGEVKIEPMPVLSIISAASNEVAKINPQLISLRAAAPIRARCNQADMSDTPLFGQGALL